MVIVLVLAVQGALAIVHVKVVVPKGKLLAVVVGEFALLNVTAPLLAVQVPVPKAGTLPAKVAVLAGPATDVEGLAFLIIVTSAETGEQEPFETVQRNVFTPSERLLTALVAEDGVVTIPEPITVVQTPLSPFATTGVEPVKVPVVKQVGVKPALAVTPVGALKRVMVIVLVLDVQEPFAIVQVKVVVPVGILFAVDVGEFALPNVTAPLLAVQVPVPKAGTLPAKVAVLVHIV
jgi:hypothetical protein